MCSWLTQESVNAYMDFLNSMFSLSRRGTQTAGRATREVGEVPLHPGPEVPPGGEVGQTLRRGTCGGVPRLTPRTLRRKRAPRPMSLPRRAWRSDSEAGASTRRGEARETHTVAFSTDNDGA